MSYNVEFTDEFESWWISLTGAEQDAIDAVVHLLGEFGPQLRFPYSSAIKNSRHGRMRELRVQRGGDPYRILYAFDPRRAAILLMGGKKTGDDRWYEKAIQAADDLYDEHLRTLKDEGYL